MQLCKNSISYQKNYLTVGKTTSPLGDYKGKHNESKNKNMGNHGERIWAK